MYEIKLTKELAENVKDFYVEAPVIARKRKAGQFVLVRINENGERIPLTIVDSDPAAGTIRLIFQEVGKTTAEMGLMKAGDSLIDVVGPLGRATHIQNYGTVVCVGGGIGVAPVFPIAKAMKEAGNTVISIIGARNKDLLILEKEMAEVSDKLLVTTDDGSYGRHGFVTDAIQSLVDEGVKIDHCVAIGPVVMMRAVSNLTKQYEIETQVSLNSIMIDGTGMCGGCRVSVGGKTKFVCVDGPEFDGHLVDFGELIMRQSAYVELEKDSLARFNHKCRLEGAK